MLIQWNCIQRKKLMNKDPKFKVGDRVRICKYKNIFAKGCTLNWFEEVFLIKKVKNTAPSTYVFNDLNGEEIMVNFMEKNCRRLIKKNLEQKKYLKEMVINYMSNEKDIIIVI